MATKLAAMLPLLGPFTAKCLAAYASQPAELGHFQNLTLADLQIGTVTRAAGVHTADINSTTRNFRGPKQTWKPATVHSETAFSLVTEEALDDKAAVALVTVPGVYAYMDAEAALKYIAVLPTHTATGAPSLAAAIAMVKDALQYDLPAGQFIAGTASHVLVNGDAVYGEVEYILAAEDPVVVPEGAAMQL